jgi:hypothetical protein
MNTIDTVLEAKRYNETIAMKAIKSYRKSRKNSRGKC